MDIAKIRRCAALLPFPGPAAVAMLADEIELLRAENEALKANSVHLYNLGYHAGHNDTVEACYMHIVAADMETCHSDVVAEIMAALAAKEE